MICDFHKRRICYSCIEQEEDGQEEDVMRKKGYSRPGFFGDVNHYNNK